jgi:hypothetical protein
MTAVFVPANIGVPVKDPPLRVVIIPAYLLGFPTVKEAKEVPVVKLVTGIFEPSPALGKTVMLDNELPVDDSASVS